MQLLIIYRNKTTFKARCDRKLLPITYQQIFIFDELRLRYVMVLSTSVSLKSSLSSVLHEAGDPIN